MVGFFGHFSGRPFAMGVIALAGPRRIRRVEHLAPIRIERDAIHRAYRQAQFAPRAFRCDDGVHGLAGSHDRVHRANWQTARAADAVALVDPCDFDWPFTAALRIKRHSRPSDQCSEHLNAIATSRRTAVWRDLVRCQRMRVSATVVITTALTLRLRQCYIEAVD